jgi:hypothetical protein
LNSTGSRASFACFITELALEVVEVSTGWTLLIAHFFIQDNVALDAIATQAGARISRFTGQAREVALEGEVQAVRDLVNLVHFSYK